jgi:hypothetical protein
MVRPNSFDFVLPKQSLLQKSLLHIDCCIVGLSAKACLFATALFLQGKIRNKPISNCFTI